MQWLIASRSAGKLAELLPLLTSYGVSAIGLNDAAVAMRADEEGIEIFDSFEENAVAKARYFHERTGLPCLADDSGLCVAALDGRPGVRSRRFASDEGVDVSTCDEDLANNVELLRACSTSGHAAPWRAFYACAVAYVDHTQAVVQTAYAHGKIIGEPRGDDGFGYDPYFFSDDLLRTFAQATRDEKARVSHRGRALALLLAKLGSSITGSLSR